MFTGSSPRQLRQRWDDLCVLALTVIVAVSWYPVLDAPFGDNHEGRVFGRHALQAANLLDHGLVGSHFGAEMDPYSSPYAHHPPLPLILNALVAGGLPGESAYEIRLGPYALAVLAIPAGAWLLRSLGVGRVATVLALGLMACTGYYWVYARLQFELAPILAMTAGVVLLRQGRRGWPLIALTCLASVAAVLATWSGLAIAAVLGLWLLAGRRRLDRATVAVGASMAGAAALALVYVFGLAGAANLGAQTRFRTVGGDFDVAQFLARQWEWASGLLPWWYLLLLPAGIVAGVLGRRTRFVTIAFTVWTAGWVFALPNGSYIHDYWGYLVLLPGLVGMGALLSAAWAWLRTRVPERPAVAGVAVAGVLLALAFGGMVRGEMGREYVTRPLAAGRLVAEHGPAPGQGKAWHISFGAVRWLSYHWDLHPAKLLPATVQEAHPGDLVLMHRDRVPAWLLPGVLAHPVAQEERYVLVRARTVRTHLRDTPARDDRVRLVPRHAGTNPTFHYIEALS